MELPIDVWFLGEKVWNLHMTEENAWWDCPNGTHYTYDGEILNPVCELTHMKRVQTIKLKKIVTAEIRCIRWANNKSISF